MSKNQPFDSVGFYDRNAQDFRERTFELDMAPLYQAFLRHLPEGARILDAGCGPGRDVRAFAERGYRVTGFDASAEMVRLAKAATGQDVRQLRFEEMAWESAFEGIWACASLLHVPAQALPEVIGRIEKALVPGGVFYCSFKYGQGERQRGERRFTDLDEAGLLALLEQVPGLEVLEWWRTEDIRADHASEYWLNALLSKKAL